VNVFLDGEYVFSLADTETAHLQVGQRLEDATIRELERTDARARAYSQALLFLALRPRSQREVKDNLAAKGYSNDEICAVLKRLKDGGLVDDLAFAQYWVDQRQTFRPRSIAALRHELRQKGVEPETIASSVGAVDEEALAYQAATKWVRHGSLLTGNDLQKLSSFLLRRGFSYRLVRETVSRVAGELGRDLSSTNDSD